jgi:regulator of protease activity HflC (stomatin/prohibitin superfamily)
MIVTVTVVVVVVLLLLILAATSVRIAREYQRLVVFRLGRAIGPRGPGVVFLNPVTDRTRLVDLREQYLEVPHQTAITRDNAPISIDFIIFYKVVDPSLSVLAVQNFAGAALNVASTTLRSVVGDMPLDDVLSKREQMNASLRVRLDEVTERWGVKVTNVEVREVNPPPTVQEAMTRQMSAERTRRAQVTEAEGQKQAAILSAEGQKQAAVTLAEGQTQASILAADGERQSALLKAQGFSGSLETIFGVARTLDEKTLALQYLETLKQIGAAPSTKFVLPMELGNVLSGVRGLLEGAGMPSPGAPGAGSTSGGGPPASAGAAPQPPDVTAAPPDVTAAPPDVTAAPPDVTAAPPDVTAAPPEAEPVPPEAAPTVAEAETTAETAASEGEKEPSEIPLSPARGAAAATDPSGNGAPAG